MSEWVVVGRTQASGAQPNPVLGAEQAAAPATLREWRALAVASALVGHTG